MAWWSKAISLATIEAIAARAAAAAGLCQQACDVLRTSEPGWKRMVAATSVLTSMLSCKSGRACFAADTDGDAELATVSGLRAGSSATPALPSAQGAVALLIMRTLQCRPTLPDPCQDALLRCAQLRPCHTVQFVRQIIHVPVTHVRQIMLWSCAVLFEDDDIATGHFRLWPSTPRHASPRACQATLTVHSNNTLALWGVRPRHHHRTPKCT